MSIISQFMHSPKEAHLQAMYKILWYPKFTPYKGILLKKNEELSLEAYNDANWTRSVVDRKSTLGYCTILEENLPTWRSKKQAVIVKSSIEVEFKVMTRGICGLLWLKIIPSDLEVKSKGTMKLYWNNKSMSNITHNPIQHDRIKHIDVDWHFVKEKLNSGLICTPYVSILTKGLRSPLLVGNEWYLLTSLRGSVNKSDWRYRGITPNLRDLIENTRKLIPWFMGLYNCIIYL